MYKLLLFISAIVPCIFGSVQAQNIDAVLGDNAACFYIINAAGDTIATFRGDGKVGIGKTNVDNSAALEVSSTEKGFLPPRMSTTQRNAIIGPATGLIIFNTTTYALEYYNGSSWQQSSSVPPMIGLNKSVLNPVCAEGSNAITESFDIFNSGAGMLSYSISDDQTWLSCSPASGTSTGEQDAISVTYNTIALAIGSYSATITITASGAPNTPQSVTVNLTVRAGYALRDTGPAGGLICYINPNYLADGWHYLEAAPSDQSAGLIWGDYSTTGATATAIGTGRANTNTIVDSLGAGSYAAQLCNDLTLGGYDDWFLPSKDELNQMYVDLKAHGVGGFDGDPTNYWSSSEDASIGANAWLQVFSSGYQGVAGKGNNPSRVRAIRAF